MLKKIFFSKGKFLILLFSLSIFTASSQELKLWYDTPAVKWTDALPLGNGRIGAMVFGGIAQDRIQFNEETLWTGGPRNYSRPGAYRYLDSIRYLLFTGKQKDAEVLAENEFMGLKSNEGRKSEWINAVMKSKELSSANYNDSKWKTMTVPSYEGWEAAGFDGLDGAVWFRKTLDLPASWVDKDVVLDLNRIRDQDFTYINGKLVGAQDNTEARKYRVPKGTLHAGRNSLAILVLNFNDKGGIAGYKDTSRHIGIYLAANELEKLSLNGDWKYFVVDDSPPAVGTYQASYQPFGDIYLNFKNTDNASLYRRELDINEAVARTTYSIGDITFKREYFISQPSQVLAVNLSASKKSSISCEVVLSSPHKKYSLRKIDANTIALYVQVRNGALKGESYLTLQTDGGQIDLAAEKISITNANGVNLYLSAGTNYKNYKDVSGDPALACRNAMKSIIGKTYTQLRAAHVKEYQHYFHTFSISLGRSDAASQPTDIRLEKFAASGDPSFVALYLQYGRYLLIASSRPGTRPPNLQGIWNDLLNPPWGGKYTTNINAEMNYWPAELLNLSVLHDPLFDMIRELATTGKQTAKDHYNMPGWVLHHNTDLWRGTAPINAANHGIWVTGGAWLCQHLWEHYLYTRDANFLRNKAYPLMKEAALFFNAFLVKDPVTGYLISSPSNSPEQGGLVAGPTMDHQIIRTLFSNVITAGEQLGLDAALRQTLKLKMDSIAPNKIGRYGQLQEWMQDKDDTSNKHRHISHLWGMYPGSEINWDESPDLMKAARQSLLYRGDAATGWSLGWKINCWARFKDGEHTFQMIRMLLSPVKGGAGSYTNLFDAHPPFQIDGNFGGAAGIGEMFLQSHSAFIDILPALPSGLPDGEVKGICARGGFVLDIKWHNGQLTELKILSKSGMPLSLRYNGKELKKTTTKNGIYKFDALLKSL